MKNIYFLLTVISFQFAFSQQYQSKSFVYGDSTRKYLLYVPNAYDGSYPVPLVLALHGLGDNINNFKGINLNKVADTANFILVIPQALVDNVFSGSAAWNSGAGAFGITLNPNVDDVGFLNALIDTTSLYYNIDQTRVYATGFSMGGFMSNRLAFDLSNRIAAIASVAGTKGNAITGTPPRKIPVAHFHGTADATVSYTANNFGNNPEDLVNFWVSHNNANPVPIIDSLPNTKSDGRTVIKYYYEDGDFGTDVEFYKIVGGTHEWLATPTNDVSFSTLIWQFFSRHQWKEQTLSSLQNNLTEMSNLKVYPNPSNDKIVIENSFAPNSTTKIDVFDFSGRNVFSSSVSQTQLMVNTEAWSRGIYFIHAKNEGVKTMQRVVISR